LGGRLLLRAVMEYAGCQLLRGLFREDNFIKSTWMLFGWRCAVQMQMNKNDTVKDEKHELLS